MIWPWSRCSSSASCGPAAAVLGAARDCSPAGAAGTSAAGAATALADLTAAAADDHDRVDELAEAAPHAVLVTVPLLTDDVHDVDGLRRIAELLTA